MEEVPRLPGTEVLPMRHSHPATVREHVTALRRQFLQDGDLPFTDVLTEGVVAPALATLTGWLDRIYSPLVTLWVFLGQVLSADHSCRAAIARLRRRPGPGRQGQVVLAVEGAAGVPVRRDDGHDAGHPGEPGGVPPGVQPG